MINFVTDEQRVEYKEWLRAYINKHCIWRCEPGELPIRGKAPGTVYTWQFYLRRGMFRAEFAEYVALLFLDMVQSDFGHFNFQLAGMETASTPLLSSIPLVARRFGIDINAISVRKERKNYGLYNWVEGLPNDLPILLVDDMCNSTESMRKAMQVLVLDQHLKIMTRTFSIVNKKRRNEPNIQYDKNMPENCKALYIFDLDDLQLKYTRPEI